MSVAGVVVAGVLSMGALAGCSEPTDETSSSTSGPPTADEPAPFADADDSIEPDEAEVALDPETPADSEPAAAESDAAAPASPSVTAPEGADGRWAVVLAGASGPGDPLLELAIADAAEAGFDAAATNCDRGAAETLAMAPGQTYTVSVYAETADEAEDIRRRLAERDVVGLVAIVVQECTG